MNTADEAKLRSPNRSTSEVLVVQCVAEHVMEMHWALSGD